MGAKTVVWLSLKSFLLYGMTFNNHSAKALSENVSKRSVDSSNNDGLSQIYARICSDAVKISSWPDSKNFCKQLLRNSEGNLCPPAFDDGHGPIGVFAMLYPNADARRILSKCNEAFDSFRDALKQEVFQPHQWSNMKNYIFRPDESSHHICVSIFHEHPSLLHTEQDKQNWQPIDRGLRTKLVSSLSEYQSGHCHCPVLILHSMLWTPDGAMIAGFLDATSDDCYQHVRTSSVDIATKVLGGELTTRPKNLIHVTIGRIFGLPSDASATQRNAMTELMRSYNQNVLPNTVRPMVESDQHRFTLTHVSLVRNNIWLMEDYTEHASWPLKADERT